MSILVVFKRLIASLAISRLGANGWFFTPAQAGYPRTGKLRVNRSRQKKRTPFSWQDLVQRGLTHPGLPAFLIFLAALAGLTTLWYGPTLGDDLLQRQVLLSSSLGKSAASLFVFLDPRINLARMDLGSLPWWTDPQARVAFFRPLAALSLWLDYRLWPGSPVLMHLHSLIWYAALCCLAGLFFRRLLGRTAAAGLAALLFTVNVPHFSSLAALNARNVLQSAFFGLLALVVQSISKESSGQSRWLRNLRAGGGRQRTPVPKLAAWAGPLCLALSLLFAEAGLAAAAYLFAYAIFMGTGPVRERLKSLTPYALVCLLWYLLYTARGYGLSGSDFYLNPISQVRLFAKAVLEHWPVLLFGQWFLPDPGLYLLFSAQARLGYWLFTVLFLGLVAVCLLPLLRQSREARFLALGMALSAVPACAVIPATGRHLMFIGIGATGLMALFSTELVGKHGWLPGGLKWRISAWAMAAFLLMFQGVLYPIAGLISRDSLEGDLFSAMMDLEAPEALTGQDVVLVTAASPGQSIYLLGLRQYRDQSLPEHLRVLAPIQSSVSVARLDRYTLLVRPENGFLLQPGARLGRVGDLWPVVHYSYATQVGDVLFRSRANPMPLGYTVSLTGMEAEVVELTEDGRPQAVRFRFDRPLEDPSLHWLSWNWQTYRYLPFVPPASGETVTLPGPF